MYKIGQFSRLVGIPTRTIHTWERRYGLLQSGRARTGHRLYNDRNIQEARCIQDLLSAGVSLTAIVLHPSYAIFRKPDTVRDHSLVEILGRIQKDLHLLSAKIITSKGGTFA